MARQVPRQAGEEHVNVVSNGPIPSVDLPAVDDQSRSGVIGSALDRGPQRKPGEGPPPPRRFRVTKGGTIFQGGEMGTGGYRTTLREGKEISALHYDIRALQQQGIRLEEIKDEPQLDEDPYTPVT